MRAPRRVREVRRVNCAVRWVGAPASCYCGPPLPYCYPDRRRTPRPTRRRRVVSLCGMFADHGRQSTPTRTCQATARAVGVASCLMDKVVPWRSLAKSTLASRSFASAWTMLVPKPDVASAAPSRGLPTPLSAIDRVQPELVGVIRDNNATVCLGLRERVFQGVDHAFDDDEADADRLA